MKLIILGAAAGGGFPQWNCACPNCNRARCGDPSAQPRTQASLAVSVNNSDYVIFNASPDLREQILATKALHPRAGLRDSPIAAAVLTGGDVDFTAGLLNLREGQRFGLYASRRILDLLDSSMIFRVLDPDLVERRVLARDVPNRLADGNGRDLGLVVEPFVVPGKVALYAEDAGRPDFGSSDGDTIGLRISDDSGKSFFYIPGCARVSDDVASRVRDADLVLFDGTLWHDNEMIDSGLSAKSGARMGHVSAGGSEGSIAAFAGLGVARKVFVHVNNSNPMILDDSPERAEAERAGWTIAHDGMEIVL